MPDEKKQEEFKSVLTLQYNAATADFRFSMDAACVPIHSFIGQVEVLKSILLDAAKQQLAAQVQQQMKSKLVVPGGMAGMPRF